MRCTTFILAAQGKNLTRGVSEKHMQDDPATLQKQHAVQGLFLGGARQPDARHHGKAMEKSLTEPKGAHAVHGLLLGGPRRPDTRSQVEALRALSRGLKPGTSMCKAFLLTWAGLPDTR